MVLVVTTTVPVRVYHALRDIAAGLGVSISETVLKIAYKSSEYGRLPVTIKDLEGDPVFEAARREAKSDRKVSLGRFIERMGGRLQRYRRPSGKVARIKLQNRPDEDWQVDAMALLARMAWEYQSASRAVMWSLAGIMEVAKRAGTNEAIKITLEDLLKGWS